MQLRRRAVETIAVLLAGMVLSAGGVAAADGNAILGGGASIIVNGT